MWKRKVLSVLGCLAVVLSVQAVEENPGTQSGTTGQSELVPLDIRLPEPVYAGTPLAYWSAHLEITFKKRPPFLAPKGAQNVALGKPATASATPTLGRVEMITDGNKEALDEQLVELPNEVQWVQVDLQGEYVIYAIVVWHFHAGERVYFDIICRVANDPDFTQNVQTLYNNDHDNSSGLGVGKDKEYVDSNEGRLIDGKGTKARYVRLYSKGNTTDEMNHYLEIEVYATPAG